jgi:membrane protein implicated in regulation of membrane protease activity
MNHELLSPTLLWFLFGCFLLFIELLTPSLVIFFFGFGAWIASVVAAYTDASFNTQILVFIISSLMFLMLLRNKVRELMGAFDHTENKYVEDDFTGRIVTVIEPITPTSRGKIDLNGSQWSAISDDTFAVGEHAYIVGKESITFILKRNPH